MMNITMPRGDIRHVEFSITDTSGEPIDEDFDEIYFTVKENTSRSAFLFQKKLSNGTIEKEESIYTFSIMPEDTNNLKFKNYDFDIEIIKGNEIKTTVVGILEITPEVTYQENEI